MERLHGRKEERTIKMKLGNYKEGEITMTEKILNKYTEGDKKDLKNLPTHLPKLKNYQEMKE